MKRRRSRLILGLDKEGLNVFVDRLLHETNGHPRLLLQALRSCDSLEKLRQFNFLQRQSLRGLYDAAHLFNALVLRFLDAEQSKIDFDMTEVVDDGSEGMAPLGQIANNLCIDWEGTADNAQVYMDPMVRSYITGWTLPLMKYLGPNVAIDCPKAFEWMVLKRFQHIFAKKCQPRQALPMFFYTPVFGQCCGVSFSMYCQPIPAITYDEYSPYRDFATVEAEGFMKMIDQMGEMCLKPLPTSASLAAFLACYADMKLRDKPAKLLCGLVVKGYDGSPPVTSVHLKMECENFNRLVTGTSLKPLLRILIVGCTSYSEEIMSKFNGKAFFVDERTADYPKIDEVIVLDLTSPKRRAEFFELSDYWCAFVENAVRPLQEDSLRLR
ncbi:hypothetical protein Ae201684_012422 [Aphanomyces euteiches]|uniref:Uncharacterized protein n=1 Tax=Aphanomyces euteiches TaxID=100861 RepID=A0A6G0WRT4_9STRA|nr:hypothetical protein Ae201684_012422 [Aphanomyces euteiches]